MRAAAIVMGLALAAEMGAAPAMEAQVRAADLVTAARAQLRAGSVDSGLVLVGLALDSSTMATGRDRVNALVWRGVLQYFKGRDSLAHESFRDALSMDPRLEVAGLAQIDSLLAADFEAVRRSIQPPPTAQRPTSALARVAGGPTLDTLYSCVPECRGLRSEEHTSELQSQSNLVCRLLLEKKKKKICAQRQVKKKLKDSKEDYR